MRVLHIYHENIYGKKNVFDASTVPSVLSTLGAIDLIN